MKDFIENVISYIIAILRFLFLLIIMLLNGLQQIIFNRIEICNIGFSYVPIRKDRDKISYINKLNLENVDLIKPYNISEDDNGDNLEEGI